MKTVVCFGDTNTWGVDPITEKRIEFEKRWTGILACELWGEYRVLEEGQPGRTIMTDDPVEPHKNGYKYLIPCLESHSPVDLVVIMLGTVLLKGRFHQTSDDIAISIDLMVNSVVKSCYGPNGTAPKVLLISPIQVGAVEKTNLKSVFPQLNNRERQEQFRELYSQVASRNNAYFMAAEDYAETGDDGIHIALSSHEPFAFALAEKIRSILS